MKLDLGHLRARCQASFEDYEAEGQVCNGLYGEHIFKDNGSRILAVAHLDTVQQSSKFVMIKGREDRFVMCPTLDDRLGAHIILDVLPKLGLTFDVLLTDNEEIGQSTAADFVGKDYNWMFSFDRMGTEVVMYEYETKHLRKAVRVAGGQVGFGSFSDISSLGHLGCAGFNWATGYYDCHSLQAYASERDAIFGIETFLKFYKRNFNTFHQYNQQVSKKEKKLYRKYGRYSWQNDVSEYSFRNDATYDVLPPADRSDWIDWEKACEKDAMEQEREQYEQDLALRDEFWYDPYSDTRARIV